MGLACVPTEVNLNATWIALKTKERVFNMGFYVNSIKVNHPKKSEGRIVIKHEKA